MQSPNDTTVFIGCGTGRSGTVALSKLLDGCENTICTHERRPLLPWMFQTERFQERVRWFSNATTSLIGDVAYYYLPYLERFMRIFPGMKIICLERDRQEVIDSYMGKTPWRNHWYNHDGTHWVRDDVWDVTYPKYDLPDKSQAIGAYWADYRRQIRRLAETYADNVCLFRIDILNTRHGQKRIFDFLEIPTKHRRFQAKRQYNARPSACCPVTQEEVFARMHRCTLTAQELDAQIPLGDSVVLVDQEAVRDLIPTERQVIPFLERDGQYWGLPPDDDTAIRELERLRRCGARFIVFAWPAFWWLDYYAEFHCYLRAECHCVLQNDRLVVFELRR